MMMFLNECSVLYDSGSVINYIKVLSIISQIVDVLRLKVK